MCNISRNLSFTPQWRVLNTGDECFRIGFFIRVCKTHSAQLNTLMQNRHFSPKIQFGWNLFQNWIWIFPPKLGLLRTRVFEQKLGFCHSVLKSEGLKINDHFIRFAWQVSISVLFLFFSIVWNGGSVGSLPQIKVLLLWSW